MATIHRNPPRPMGHSTVQKSRTKKATTQQQPPSTTTNNSTKIKTRVGNKSQTNSMNKPSSILKRKPFEGPHTETFNQNVTHRHPPSDPQTHISRPFYSPIHTPPRLRALTTPPGIEPYRNNHDLRRLNNPLPGLDDLHSPPVHLDTWGLDPTDPHLKTTLNLMRRYPSPLSHFGLGNVLHKQRKSYIVVPRLTNFLSPPVSSGGAHFTLPSRRVSPMYIPDSRYTYLDRIHSFSPTRFHREPTDYVYIRQNEAFANHYIEDFIGKCIEDQFIPDILLEIISELDQENKKRGGKSYKTEVDRYNAELNKRINQEEINNTHLFSDEWIRELDHQRLPIPASNIHSNKSSLRPLDFKETPSVQTAARLRYQDLPTDVQGRLLADLNQELIDFEIQNMATESTGQTLSNRIHNVPMSNNSRRDVMHDTNNTQRNQIQYNEVEKYAQNKFLDTICLDQSIVKYIKQNDSVVDVDELSRLLDANILGNLISEYQDIDENRSRTLDNYGTKKFHLNSYMNITMDFLLTELSASLIEDMKDLDEQEHKTFL